VILRLCNVLEDAHHLGELPPLPLLAELGKYLQALAGLVHALGAQGRVVSSRHEAAHPGCA
jgi:hypothetical protein